MLLQWARAIGADAEAWCREALNGKGRYADTVRHVHAVLSLPQAYTGLYQELNQCIKEQRSLSLCQQQFKTDPLGIIFTLLVTSL